MNLFKIALFSKEWHRGQIRKGNKRPYFSHPLEASQIFRDLFPILPASQWQLAALLCHDLLEDTNCSKNDILEILKQNSSFMERLLRYPHRALTTVEALTNDKKKIAMFGKTNYMRVKLLGMSSIELLLKLIDIYHNCMSLEGTSDKFSKQFTARIRELLEFIVDHSEQYSLEQSHRKVLSLIDDYV